MKKIHILFFLLIGAIIAFASCSDDDNNKRPPVSEEWKAYQADVLEKVKNDPSYTKLESLTKAGAVYYQESDSLKNRLKSARNTVLFSDSVKVRYKGWFYTLKDQQYVFDRGTEMENHYEETVFAVGGVKGVVDGWATVLQQMEVEEEVLICIPYQLGYGEYGDANGRVPGYTTMFFSLYLKEIIRH